MPKAGKFVWHLVRLYSRKASNIHKAKHKHGRKLDRRAQRKDCPHMLNLGPAHFLVKFSKLVVSFGCLIKVTPK